MSAKSSNVVVKAGNLFFPILFALILTTQTSFARTAKETYQEHCHVCHASGLAGAPKFQSKEDWKPRCKAKHLKGLVESAIKGINAMPAKGTCDACQLKDIQAAIEYMVPKDEKLCH
jgi:cytochrome c5